MCMCMFFFIVKPWLVKLVSRRLIFTCHKRFPERVELWVVGYVCCRKGVVCSPSTRKDIYS